MGCLIRLAIVITAITCTITQPTPPASPYPRAILQYAGCRVLINEIATGNPINEFIEFAKICPSNIIPNINSLAGYFHATLELGEENVIVLSHDMTSQTLTKSATGFETYVIGGEDIQKKSTGFASISFVPQKYDTALPRDNKKTFVFLLLHFVTRTPQLASTKLALTLDTASNGVYVPKVLTPFAIDAITNHVQDAAVAGAKCEDTGSCEIIGKIWAGFKTPEQYTIPWPSVEETDEASLSRCSGDALPFSSRSYRHSTPTPGMRNKCSEAFDAVFGPETAIKYPYSFERRWLQHQARQMVMNAIAFFSYAKTNPQMLEGSAETLVGRTINLGQFSIRDTVKRSTAVEGFKTPRITKTTCRTLDSFNEMDKNTLREIIMGFYREGRSPFLKDIYFRFVQTMRVRKCVKTREELNIIRTSVTIASQLQEHDKAISAGGSVSRTIRISEDEARRLLPAGSATREFIREVTTSARSTPPTVRPTQPTMKPVSEPTQHTIQETPGAGGTTPQRASSTTTDKGIKKFALAMKTFRKLLKSTGFMYGKINTRMAIVQRPDIVDKRGRFLREIKANNASTNPKPIIWMDETWVDANQRFKKGWIPIKYKGRHMYTQYSFAKQKIGKAPRLIIIGAASSTQGVIKELVKIYKVKKGDEKADYHENINGEVFMKWIQELLAYLDGKEQHIVVLDNAPYHSKSTAPLSKATKKDMYDWLELEARSDSSLVLGNLNQMRRDALWDMVKERKQKHDYYEVDKVLEAKGHKVLRLPPYNCDLNPIEFLWADAKRQIAMKNTEQNIDKVHAVAEKVIGDFPMDKWKKVMGHVDKLENKYWEEDNMAENTRSDMRITIDLNDDEEDDEDEEEEDGLQEFVGDCELSDIQAERWLAVLGIQDSTETVLPNETEPQNTIPRRGGAVKRRLDMSME